jgi:propionyl-CoA carboxylase alpha chain
VRYQPSPAQAHQQPIEPSAAAEAAPYTRVDDGVFEGGEVSMFYDPMIAKLVT